jgi:hypothetical protein
MKKRGPLIGLILEVLAVAAIGWGVVSHGDSPSLNLLIAIAGALIGWIMLMAPVSEIEAKRFPELWKSAFSIRGGVLGCKGG